MVKAARRKLKVFQSQLGFYDTVVAAPSQAAALRAWGVHQNLFADGQARVAEDAQAIEAALVHPDTPLRRAIGSTDPFALEPVSLPKAPDAPKTAATKPKPKPAAPAKPTADRTALNAAEAALRQLDLERKEEEAQFRRRQDELDAERETAQAAYVAGHKSVTAAVIEARDAYRRNGGET